MSMEPGRLTLGAVLLCIGGAFFLGLQIPFSKLAYAEGTDPFGLVLIRAAMAVLVFAVAGHLARRSFAIPKPAWPALIIVTLANLGIAIGYLGAAARIEGSLAALIMYLFPIMVLIVDAVLHRRLPGPRRIGVGLGAFIGLAIVFGPAFQNLDPIGIALALLAAVSATTFMLTAGGLQAHMNGLALMVWSNLFHIPLFAAVVFGGAGSLPLYNDGWLYAGIAAASFSLGLWLTFLAVRVAGGVRASIIFNVEPVAVAMTSIIILGEILSLQQYLGMALVIACVTAATALREQ